MPYLRREDQDWVDQKEALSAAGKATVDTAKPFVKGMAESIAQDAPVGLAIDKFLLNRPIGQLGETVLAKPASSFWGQALNNTRALAGNVGNYIKAYTPSAGGYYGVSMLSAPYEMKQRADAVQKYYDYYEGQQNQNEYDRQMQETGSFPYMQAFWDATKHRWKPAAEGFINSASFGTYDLANNLLRMRQQQQPEQ